MADLAHNASALQSLMYTAGTKGKREVDKEICRQHCAVASLFLRGVQAKRARRDRGVLPTKKAMQRACGKPAASLQQACGKPATTEPAIPAHCIVLHVHLSLVTKQAPSHRSRRSAAAVARTSCCFAGA